MQPLPLGDLSATPWSVSPLWFAVLAVATPALAWLAFAWRRALLECPNRTRRAGVREMRRLLKNLRGSGASLEPAHLHAWLRAAARTWDVRTSAPAAHEISHAAHALTGDRGVSSRWRDLWLSTEHGLYSADARPAQDWLDRVSQAAAALDMPKRERLFPNRLSHWLPCIVMMLIAVASLTPPALNADVPWSAPPASEKPAEEPAEPRLSAEVQQAAVEALKANWGDWAAHRNLAAFEIQEGDLNRAIAHGTFAFIQHPTSSTRDTLLAALGDAPATDPTLSRLLSGKWYERAPALLSAAQWQRVALIAALIAAAGLSVLVFALYARRESGRFPAAALSWVGGSSAAIGVLTLAAALCGWSAYGPLNQPAAAMLVQNVNLSPVPTDLVPEEETSPLAAGTFVVADRTFLGWRQVRRAPEVSGWIRGGGMMPVYAD